MAAFTANGNGPWFVVVGDGFQPSFTGDFDGGTITFQVKVGSTAMTLLDRENLDVAFSYTSAFNDLFNLKRGTVVRPVLAGAGSPAIEYEMNGCVETNI